MVLQGKGQFDTRLPSTRSSIESEEKNRHGQKRNRRKDKLAIVSWYKSKLVLGRARVNGIID